MCFVVENYIYYLWYLTSFIWGTIHVVHRYYYNPKLGSGYNLDKELSKKGENNQLVKCKDTGLYLLLYIHINYKKIGWYSWRNNKKSEIRI